MHRCWGCPGVTDCQAWSLQAGAAEPQGLHQARPDARVSERGLLAQLEIDKGCILLERLRDECKSYFARDAQSIHSEDSILVIDVLCCAMLSHSVVSNFL